jgi:hypothetical protein
MKIRAEVEVEVPDGVFCRVDEGRRCRFAYISHSTNDHCELFNAWLDRSYLFPVGGEKTLRTHKCDKCLNATRAEERENG